MLPRPGTPLPPNPTLFFFVPPDAEAVSDDFVANLHAVTDDGRHLKISVEQLRGGGELLVWRLDIVAPVGANFHLEPNPLEEPDWPVRANPTTDGAFEPKRGKDLFDKWMCSYESLRVLDANLAAPAFRIEFAETEVALEQGKGESVVEGAEDGFSRWLRHFQGKRRPAMALAVRLGHHNCWGSNMEWKSPQLAVRVSALLSDGTERASPKVFILDAPLPWSSKR